MASIRLGNQVSSEENRRPDEVLNILASDLGCDIKSTEFAKQMDNMDPLRTFREEFIFPEVLTSEGINKEVVHLCGQSLGLKPKRSDEYVKMALANWAHKGVNCHFDGFLPALICETLIQEDMADLVGALPSEVAVLNGLTVNLHLMLVAFYKPTKERFKIMIEGDAFGSDMYAVKSQIALHGFCPETALVTLKPRKGEHCLRPEDLLATIMSEGSQTALILLPGVQYLTGQKLDLPPLIKAGHEQGCIVGLELAHAVGNVPLYLHDWGADFAVWCTYKNVFSGVKEPIRKKFYPAKLLRLDESTLQNIATLISAHIKAEELCSQANFKCFSYLNSGPGSLGALWVHERHCPSLASDDKHGTLHLQGWFGNKLKTRMEMNPDFDPEDGAARFKLSNTSPVMVAMIKASLEIFKEAGIERLFKKQFLLTGYLEYLLKEELKDLDNQITIITPSVPSSRGCQLSVQFAKDVNNLADALRQNGIDVDVRKGKAMRVAPVPLYNSFQDVWTFVTTLKNILSSC